MNKVLTTLAAFAAALTAGAQIKTNETMINYHKIQVEDCNVFQNYRRCFHQAL